MMVSANVDLVRSIYADWERGDFSDVEWAHPDIEWVAVDGLSPGSSRGIAAMGAAWRDFVTDWADFRAEADEYRELDDGRVLALHRFSGRGKTSGVAVAPTGAAGACLFHIRQGMVTTLSLYSVRDRALADLGLEEQAASQENVEVVRRLLEAVNRRDWDAMLETGEPEIEIVTLMTGTHRGHAAWRRLVEQMAEELAGFQFVPEDLIDVGQDRVVAVTRWVGTGGTSGIAVPDTTIGFVYTLRDGLVVRQESFPNKAEALKAVGLEE